MFDTNTVLGNFVFIHFHFAQKIFRNPDFFTIELYIVKLMVFAEIQLEIHEIGLNKVPQTYMQTNM